MKKIDLNSWKRKEHFEFFSSFDEPYFSMVADVDVTEAYQYCKQNKYSFLSWYLYQSLRTVNEIEELRYRIVDGEPVVYDNIHASSTFARPDETFGIGFVYFSHNFPTFMEEWKKETERIQSFDGLGIDEKAGRQDLIHYSAIPWVKFTSLSHARHFAGKDSVPKISFGKMVEEKGRKLLPVSIHVHHALADGLHVGKFFEQYQKNLNGV